MARRNNQKTLKNNTTMEIQIIKQGDFTLKHFDYHDSYFLFYKTCAIWEYKFNELFGTQLTDLVFEIEPDPNKAVEFLNELHKWGFSQPGTLEKILEKDYGEKI